MSISRIQAVSLVRWGLSPFLHIETRASAAACSRSCLASGRGSILGPRHMMAALGSLWSRGERRNQGWCELLGISLCCTYAVS